MPASIWFGSNADDALIKTDQTGSVITSLTASNVVGVGYDTSDSIWYTDDDIYYQYDSNGSIQKSFVGPASVNIGAGVNASDSIWNTDVASGANDVNLINQFGSVISNFTPSTVAGGSDFQNPWDTTVTSAQSVVIPSVTGSALYTFDENGTSFDSIVTAVPCIFGLGIESGESFWLSNRSNDRVRKVNKNNSVITSFIIGNFTQGVATTDEPLQTGPTTSLWNADTNDVVFGIDETGSIATSFTFSGARAIGIDTGNCLWISDDTGAPHRIEKTDQGGTTVTSFTAPSTVEDLSVDLNDCIILVDDNDDSVKQSNQTGSISRSFSTPSNSPRGAVIDSGNCIWVADAANSVYQVDQNGNQQNQLAVGTTSLRGIGINASQCLFVAESGDSIVTINQNGTEQSTIATPSNEPFGVAHVNEPQGQIKHGGASIWVGAQSGLIRKYDRIGSVIQSFNPPASDPAGLSNDTDDCLWNTSRGTGDSVVYQTNQTGSVISSFNVPSSNPEACGVDEEECIWVSVGANITQFDQNGNVVTAQFGTQNQDINTAAFDLSDCFWVADDNQCQIARTDQNGCVTSTFNQLNSQAFGLGIDSSECLWHTDRGSGCIVVQFDKAGNVISSFSTGVSNIFGITTEDEPINATTAVSLGAVLRTSTGILDTDSSAVIQTQQ